MPGEQLAFQPFAEQLDPGIMTLSLEPVITVTDGDRVQGNQQVRWPGRQEMVWVARAG